MDGQRFDELTRVLAHGATRRVLARGLFGGVAAALGLARGAGAVGQPLGATCIRASHCASGRCDPATRRCANCPGATTGEFDPCNPQAGGICCVTPDSCCGGDCCPTNGCQVGDEGVGDPPLFCCGNRSTTICGDKCCAGGSDNPDCVAFNGGTICSRRELVCKADDGVTDVECGDACCNGRCCPAGTFCTVNGCQAAGVACTTDAECVDLGYDNCAGVRFDFVFDGPNEPTLEPVADSGTCCVSGRTGGVQTPDAPFGPFDFCCDAGEYSCGFGCADYRNKGCVGTSCRCSFRITRPR